jgi:hypothetical protein
MTLTLPPLTLTHGSQVKDDFIFLKQLITRTFYVDVLATDIVTNFLKHIQKAHLQPVLDKF